MPFDRNSPAWQQIEECYRVLRRAKSNVVFEILRQSEPFVQWQHYPKGDVYDELTHSQYFYHAHPATVSTDGRNENGHFHLFVRRPESQALCHLIAISMDKYGYPIALFTTNRWVTGETWHQADEVISFLDQFNIDHAYPSWPLNLWLTAMVRLYKDEISQLVRARDEVIAKRTKQYPDRDVFEDRTLEVTSFLLLEEHKNFK